MIYAISFGVFAGVFLLAIVVILWIGIDVRVAINPDNGFAVLDCFILKAIFILKIKVKVYDGEFYMKIGEGAFRRMSHYKNETPVKSVKAKQFPRLTVHDLRTRVSVGVSDNPVFALVLIGAIGFIINNLQQIAHNRVRIKGYSELLKPDFVNDSFKVSVDANIKFSFINLLHYIFSSKKNDKGEKVDEH